MSKKPREMIERNLGNVCEIFFEEDFVPQYKLDRFKLDWYSKKLNIALNMTDFYIIRKFLKKLCMSFKSF
jgi:hypothetical protein